VGHKGKGNVIPVTGKSVSYGVEMSRDVGDSEFSVEGQEEVDSCQEEGVINGASAKSVEEVDGIGVVRVYGDSPGGW
jgi:hypothetical protein